ncbi:MAG TPA: type IV pilin protein [Solimonas sp.]|nr:type IV pilin protein [Solimonas sp.]
MHKGFSLVELMIAMLVMAILTAIGMPTYRAYVTRANRAVAKSVLGEVQSRQESYLLDRKRYSASLVALGYPADAIYLLRNGETQSAADASAIYVVRLEAPLDRSYAVAAAPLNSQARDSACGTLRIKSTGKKEATGSNGLKCWR